MEFGTFKLVIHLFMLVHADEEVVAVFAHLGLESLGILGSIGSQVGLDGDEYLTALEAFAAVLVDFDLDVWVEESEYLCCVFSHNGIEAIWEVWANNGPYEHEAG